jgi:hypothetical protein
MLLTCKNFKEFVVSKALYRVSKNILSICALLHPDEKNTRPETAENGKDKQI